MRFFTITGHTPERWLGCPGPACNGGATTEHPSWCPEPDGILSIFSDHPKPFQLVLNPNLSLTWGVRCFLSIRGSEVRASLMMTGGDLKRTLKKLYKPFAINSPSPKAGQSVQTSRMLIQGEWLLPARRARTRTTGWARFGIKSRTRWIGVPRPLKIYYEINRITRDHVEHIYLWSPGPSGPILYPNPNLNKHHFFWVRSVCGARKKIGAEDH